MWQVAGVRVLDAAASSGAPHGAWDGADKGGADRAAGADGADKGGADRGGRRGQGRADKGGADGADGAVGAVGSRGSSVCSQE